MDSWVSPSVSLIILAIQVTIAILSYFKIYRHRVIYGIRRHKVLMPTGDTTDPLMPKVDEQIEEINNELGSGKYTVLQVVIRDHNFEFVLGKIRN